MRLSRANYGAGARAASSRAGAASGAREKKTLNRLQNSAAVLLPNAMRQKKKKIHDSLNQKRPNQYGNNKNFNMTERKIDNRPI